MNEHREHVLAGIGHSLLVFESIKQNRKHLVSMARHLEQMKAGEEARIIAKASAKAMRAVADALKTAEEANDYTCKCFGEIVKCDLSERNERQAPAAGACEGDNAAPDSGRTTPATTCAPTPNR